MNQKTTPMRPASISGRRRSIKEMLAGNSRRAALMTRFLLAATIAAWPFYGPAARPFDGPFGEFR